MTPCVPKEPKPSTAYVKKLKDEYKAKKALEKAAEEPEPEPEPEPEVKPPEQKKSWGGCCKCFLKPAEASRMVVHTMQTIADGKTKEDVEAAHEQMASKAAAAGFTSWSAAWDADGTTAVVTEVFDSPDMYFAFMDELDFETASASIKFEAPKLLCTEEQAAEMSDLAKNFAMETFTVATAVSVPSDWDEAPKMIVCALQSIADGKTKADVDAAHEHVASKAKAAGFTNWSAAWDADGTTALVIEIFEEPEMYTQFVGGLDMAMVTGSIKSDDAKLVSTAEEAAEMGELIASFGMKPYTLTCYGFAA